MRRVILAFAGTLTGLVMLIGLKAHSTVPLVGAPGSVTGGSSSSAGVPSAGVPSAGGPSGGATRSGSRSSTPATVSRTGDSVSTPYGPVQVKITAVGTRVTAVTALAYPSNDSRSAQINAYAIPRLTQEAVAAGNANIDMVSGATYTSEGYARSLQSALDRVG